MILVVYFGNILLIKAEENPYAIIPRINIIKLTKSIIDHKICLEENKYSITMPKVVVLFSFRKNIYTKN